MHELVLTASEALVEPVSQALIDEFDALSVSVEDADVDTAAEQALFGEPDLPVEHQAWQRSTLRALFVDDSRATAAATVLLAQGWGADLQIRTLQPVPDIDWVRLTQSQFVPVAITATFWVVPSWHQAPPTARKVIRLDPGLAFGTGTHPTTRMCLRWIADHGQAWPRVLDYGCGSGILAIGAALHGARQVDAIDLDPAAIGATQANALVNGVTLSTGTPERASGLYPLVLANILAQPLILLAPLLASHVQPGGHLVLAGILERQAEDLRLAYAPWLTLEVRDREDGWALMVGQHDASGPP